MVCVCFNPISSDQRDTSQLKLNGVNAFEDDDLGSTIGFSDCGETRDDFEEVVNVSSVHKCGHEIKRGRTRLSEWSQWLQGQFHAT